MYFGLTSNRIGFCWINLFALCTWSRHQSPWDLNQYIFGAFLLFSTKLKGIKVILNKKLSNIKINNLWILCQIQYPFKLVVLWYFNKSLLFLVMFSKLSWKIVFLKRCYQNEYVIFWDWFVSNYYSEIAFFKHSIIINFWHISSWSMVISLFLIENIKYH